MTSYVQRALDAARAVMPGEDEDLLRLYVLLAMTKGAATTLADVHDAWALWRARTVPDHRSLVPFAQLAPDVQEMDRPYAEAIWNMARGEGRVSTVAIGEQLAAARQASGLSQRAFATIVATGQSAISEVESGWRSLHVSTLISWAGALGYDVYRYMWPTLWEKFGGPDISIVPLLAAAGHKASGEADRA